LLNLFFRPALSAEELAPSAKEESEGVKMPTSGEQALPVVRVGEIESEPSGQRWLVEELWGASSVGVIGGAPKVKLRPTRFANVRAHLSPFHSWRFCNRA
jgi:hypothetical protein